MTREVLVPIARLQRWFDGFVSRNGTIASINSSEEGVSVRTDRGAVARLPDHTPEADNLAQLVDAMTRGGLAVVVLVRRGGFSVAMVEYAGTGHEVRASKTGTRYVQGRTAAGGQSQQRFARRRKNQADGLVDAAVAAASRVLDGSPRAVDLLVTGGDTGLLRAMLEQEPLRSIRAQRTVHVATGEPRRASIDDAVLSARAIRIVVSNAPSQENH